MEDDQPKDICDEIWREIIKCGGYSSDVDCAIVEVMRDIKDNRPAYLTDIHKRTQHSIILVQLIQYIICSMDYAEYGTSPRGCWLTTKGESMLEVFEKRIKDMEEPQ